MFYAFLTYIPILYLFFYIPENEKYLNVFLIGFSIYGVFDMTNMALFHKYELGIAI